jgi:hypothetical protein
MSAEDRECALLEKNSFDRDRFDVDVPGGPVLQESKFTASGITFNVKMQFSLCCYVYLM